MKKLVNNLDKKIIFGSSLKEVDIVLKDFVKKAKTPIFNIEKATILTLAKSIILSSNKYNDYKILDDNEAEIVFYSFLDGEKNKGEERIFNLIPNESFSFNTSNNAYEVINKIRSGKIKINEKNKTENQNHKLKGVINSFEKYLKENKKLDNVAIINETITLLSKCNTNENKSLLGFVDNITINLLPSLKGYLTYQEEKFISLLEEIYNTKRRYIDYEIKSKDIIYKKAPCFGYSNVIEYIVKEIKNNNYNLNDVAIYTSTNSYDNYIKGLFDNYNIDYYFESGSNITCEDFTGLFISTLNFLGNHFNTQYLAEIYRNLVLIKYNDGLESLDCLNDISNLKADGEQIKARVNSLDIYSNNRKVFINELVDLYNENDNIYEIYNKVLQFVLKYSVLESQKYCKEVLVNKNSLFDLLKDVKFKDYKERIDKIIDILGDIKISKDCPNNAYVSINSLYSTYLPRKYNFIIGLSSLEFVKNEIESPLMSDKELDGVLDNTYYYNKITSINSENETKLNSLVNTLDCGAIYYICSVYDSINFKNLSKSSYYLNINCVEEEVYSRGEMNVNAKEIEPEDDYIYLQEKEYIDKVNNCNLSPSSIEKIVSCPLKYIYSKIYDDIQFDEFTYKWLKGGEEGNFAHEVLENYFKSVSKKSYIDYITDRKFDRAEFDKVFSEVFNKYKNNIHYDNNHIIDKEANQIKEFLLNYLCRYYEDKSDKYLPIEYELNIKYGDAVAYPKDTTYLIHGVIDRVDAYVDEKNELNVRIVDYKTYSKTSYEEHIKYKILLQRALYPCLVNNYINNHISEIETKIGTFNKKDEYDIEFVYEFLKQGKQVTPAIDDINEILIDSLGKFTELKKNPTWNNFINIYDPSLNIIKVGKFKEGRCSYCSFNKYCRLKLQYGYKKGWSRDE